jgi:AbrB family looped-hinge helix DNA binding protein
MRSGTSERPDSPQEERPDAGPREEACSDFKLLVPEKKLAPTKVRRYLTAMKTRVSSKGQIVLPAELREQDRIEAGQEFEVERLDQGEYKLKRTSAPANEGVIDWLLECPEKGYFVPIESESTDTL